nr:hypothetical protein [Tanacetum cinerariifolium]
MRLKTDIKSKEATFQVVLDALALTPFYRAFLITTDVPAIYMQDIRAIVFVHQSSIKFSDLLFHIKNKDAKKTNKMSYPRFTKTIIDYFMSNDQSISRRNKMFWHTARDDTMFTYMRYISRHEKTQLYGFILSKELTNQAMLESEAYKTYYAFAFREKTPKPKYVLKKAGSDTSPKQKPVQATKAEQLKLATKRSKKYFHISHASGSGDRVDTHLKEENDEEDDDEDDFEEEADINDNDSNDNDESDDERTESDRDEIPDPNLTNDEVTKELYDDVNMNLGNENTKMTNVDQGASEQENTSHQSGFKQEKEDAHVTLTPVLEAQKTGAYHATAIHEITSSFTTPTPPTPLFFNPLQQEATPTHTPTTFEATTSFTSLLNLASVFKVNKRVTNLEKDLSEIKQVDQYAQALSSIPAIINRYMDNKLEEAINKAIQAHNFDCREEAQAEKKGVYRTHVATPVIEKNVTESLEAAILIRSSSQHLSSYESYGEVFSLKRSQDEREKDQDPFAGSDRETKRIKSKVPSHTVKDSGMQQDQEFVTGDNDEQPADKEVTKTDWFKKPKRPLTPNPDWSKRRQVNFRPP